MKTSVPWYLDAAMCRVALKLLRVVVEKDLEKGTRGMNNTYQNEIYTAPMTIEVMQAHECIAFQGTDDSYMYTVNEPCRALHGLAASWDQRPEWPTSGRAP